MASQDRVISEVCLVLIHLVQTLVDKPEVVLLEPRTSADKTVFHLQVAGSDFRNIVGENLNAIGYLLAIAGDKQQQLWVLKINRGLA